VFKIKEQPEYSHRLYTAGNDFTGSHLELEGHARHVVECQDEGMRHDSDRGHVQRADRSDGQQCLHLLGPLRVRSEHLGLPALGQQGLGRLVLLADLLVAPGVP
jgi:hypothetical protein